jgi:hypothetical protein
MAGSDKLVVQPAAGFDSGVRKTLPPPPVDASADHNAFIVALGAGRTHRRGGGDGEGHKTATAELERLDQAVADAKRR